MAAAARRDPLASETTPVKRFNPEFALNRFGTNEAYWRGGGTVLPPEMLPVGAHAVNVVLTDSSTGQVVFDGGSFFFMDPAGVGRCA